MHRVRTSVCALRDSEDLDVCVEAGVDAVGVLCGVTHKAEDALPIDDAARLLIRVPPYMGRYVVTHFISLADINYLIGALSVDTIQLHDNIDINVVKQLRQDFSTLRIIKAIHIQEQVEKWEYWVPYVDALLLDSIDKSNDRIGGTGLTHDWTVSSKISMACPIPVILSGGLTPINVTDAIRVVKPWAVNVNSGVETSGRKDPIKLRTFVDAAASS